VDKMTLAALEATLAGPPTPVAQALNADVDTLRVRAAALAAQLTGARRNDAYALAMKLAKTEDAP
jgi:L-seryl-tRNA(Ser) seleniumtransferase